MCGIGSDARGAAKGGRVYTKDKEASILPSDQTIGSIRHNESQLSHVRNRK